MKSTKSRDEGDTLALEEAFDVVERAIDAHAGLVRVGEPRGLVTRQGWWIEIMAKKSGSRKKASRIFGQGRTLVEASEALVASLDAWKGAL